MRRSAYCHSGCNARAPDPADSRDIYDGFLQVITSKEVQDKTTAAIRSLNHTVRDIRQAFRKVNADIREFDELGLVDRNGNLLQLRPRWQILYDVCQAVASCYLDPI